MSIDLGALFTAYIIVIETDVLDRILVNVVRPVFPVTKYLKRVGFVESPAI